MSYDPLDGILDRISDLRSALIAYGTKMYVHDGDLADAGKLESELRSLEAEAERLRGDTGFPVTEQLQCFGNGSEHDK